MKRMMRTAIFLIVVVIFAGCASTPSLDRFSEFAIERKLTMPEGVSAWKPVFAHAWGGAEGSQYLYPLQWEQGYTERLTWIWNPLPLHVKVLLSSDEQQWVGGEFSLLGSVYAREKDFNWRPYLRGHFRRKVADGVAFDLRGGINVEVSREPEWRFSRTWVLEPGLFFQLPARFYIQPSLGIWNEMGYTRAAYLSGIPEDVQGPNAFVPRWKFPLIWMAGVQLSRQWEMELRGIWDGYYLTVSHYW